MTANTAGIESSAKIRSVVSITTSATSSGVAISRPPWRTRNPVPVVNGAIGMNPDPTRANRATGFDQPFLLFLAEEHSRCREHEQGGERIDHPMEALEQEQAQADEDRAHDQRAYDAPEQRTMLQRGGDAGLRENQHEQEEVVDR